jgi:hypothetical protein
MFISVIGAVVTQAVHQKGRIWGPLAPRLPLLPCWRAALLLLPQPCSRPRAPRAPPPQPRPSLPPPFINHTASTQPAAAAGSCASYGKLDFFPQGFTNEPAAWSRANQLKAGNKDKFTLFPIALYGNPWPKLHFLPIHPLLLPGGAPVPEACRVSSEWRRKRRALQQADWGSVVEPAHFNWTTSLNGGPQIPGFGSMRLDNITDMPFWSMSVWNLRDVSG